MEPFCVALTAAIEQASNAFGRCQPAPEPACSRWRSPELCADLLWLKGAFLSTRCDLDAIECGSPIEKSMGVALAERRGAFGLGIVPLAEMKYEACREFGKLALVGTESGAAVFPQAEIGPYHLDFLLLFKNAANTLLGMAVECDGHEFHEKTKRQAAHDKRRDRYVAMHSIPTLRFAGSEIHIDAAVCAEEVHRAMLFMQMGPRENAWLGYLSEAEQERRQEEEECAAQREAELREELLEEERCQNN